VAGFELFCLLVYLAIGLFAGVFYVVAVLVIKDE